jgi:terminal uridylyltransferase
VHANPSCGLTVYQLIAGAKVPIVVLAYVSEVGRPPHMVDVSVNNELPIYNTRLLRAYANFDERVRILVLCVKRWSKLVQISDAKQGNLSSYSWTILSIYYLQVRSQMEGGALLPSLQDLGKRMGLPEQIYEDPCTGRMFDVRFAAEVAQKRSCVASASELLRGFFIFYEREFRWGSEVASVRLGRRFTIDHANFRALPPGRMPGTIHIEDPLDLERNLNCVLDIDGSARLRAKFRDFAQRVADVPATSLLHQARMLMTPKLANGVAQTTPVSPATTSPQQSAVTGVLGANHSTNSRQIDMPSRGTYREIRSNSERVVIDMW